MAFIADVLYSWVRENSERLSRDLRGDDRSLLKEFKEMVCGMWITTNFEGSIEGVRVAAVDGGLMKFRLDNGGSLILASAYGVGEGVEERESMCKVIYPPYQKYAQLFMKSLELSVARKLIGELSGGGVLLLDGSLYGLLSTPP
ncbi:MAG: DNA double-strand break repair nuclease NurA [Aigarchaeota archaeon]|nr:DNA double-strand break repair nuclease NurA [Aigarchaeota archaeon]MDW8092475.1 DNA double-strand break repair nuclease NurA [Nitrososphaerota archaeon]